MYQTGERSFEAISRLQLPPEEQLLTFDTDQLLEIPHLKLSFGMRHLVAAALAGAVLGGIGEDFRTGQLKFGSGMPITPTLIRANEARTPITALTPTPIVRPTPVPTERPKPNIERTPSLDRILNYHVLQDWRERMKNLGIGFSLWDYGSKGFKGEVLPDIGLRTRETPYFLDVLAARNSYTYNLEQGEIIGRYEIAVSNGDYYLILFTPRTDMFYPEKQSDDDLMLFTARKIESGPLSGKFIELKPESKEPILVKDFN